MSWLSVVQKRIDEEPVNTILQGGCGAALSWAAKASISPAKRPVAALGGGDVAGAAARAVMADTTT